MKAPLIIMTLFVFFGGMSCENNHSTKPSGVQRADRANKLNIDISGSLQNPAFSPDGKSIVFTRFRDGYNKSASDLFIYNLETETLVPLISDGASNVNLPGSVWNRTTKSIVFSSARDPHDEIFLISDTGTTGDEIQLTARQNKQSFEPTFSPDGQWIVFESHDIDRGNNGVLTKYKIDGNSGYINLTAASDNCKQPNWSPSGDKILYQKELRGMWTIWTMNVDGGNNTQVTTSNQSNADAVFSFDGNWIIYSSENESAELGNIYRIPSAGGVGVRFTMYSGYDGAPSISPDGSKIVFESIDRNPEKSNGTALWIIDIVSPTSTLYFTANIF